MEYYCCDSLDVLYYIEQCASKNSFQSKDRLVAGDGPRSVAIGDLNGDGDPDLAVANTGYYGIETGNFSVLLGNGDGTFQSAVHYDAGNGPSSVAMGDLNGDANPDLTVANRRSNNVSVLLGNGDGTFQSAVNYDVGDGPFSVVMGDLDGDGDLDLAVANQGSYPDFIENVSVLLGNGDGTFKSAVHYDAGNGPRSIAMGDLNGDAYPDLAVANNVSNNVSVLINLLPSITVISPNGGEKLFGDGTFEITWTSFRDIDFVKIEYSINNGTEWTEIEASTENDGSYIWDVPNNPSEQCLIRISDIDDDPSDVSDAVFTILFPLWYVDGDIATSGNGTSWGEAFKTIQEAIDAANDDDVILVKQGTYFVNSTVNVTKSVSIYVGFDGTETQVSERDWQTNVTTVDGQNTVRCFYVTADATIDGLTIAHGKTSWGGGGMFISGSSPEVTNCTFLENQAGSNGGGGLHSWNASPIITNSLFLENDGGSNGGGAIFNWDCPAVIVTNCTFSENDGGSSGGGAIYNYKSSATVTNCILWGDLADSGSEIYNDAGTMTIKHCDLSGDMAGVVNVNGGVVNDVGNNMDDDPLFVDAHRLRPMSSCIDAGDNNAPELPVIDMDGNPRIIDGTVDMGAYESPGSFVEQTVWYTITP